jgi:hypothetical protein
MLICLSTLQKVEKLPQNNNQLKALLLPRQHLLLPQLLKTLKLLKLQLLLLIMQMPPQTK